RACSARCITSRATPPSFSSALRLSDQVCSRTASLISAWRSSSSAYLSAPARLAISTERRAPRTIRGVLKAAEIDGARDEKTIENVHGSPLYLILLVRATPLVPGRIRFSEMTTGLGSLTAE